MLHIYNSLTRQKEVFTPLEPGKIKLYVCGMTVYDYCHLGHARVMVGFDVIVRYLRAIGYDVQYVRNITDIDDKIIQRAHEQNIEWTALTQKFIDAMHEDARALNVLLPNEEPRATAYIHDMIDLITRLLENGKAYVADNGDVYYRIHAFTAYGALSHKDLEGLRAGARVEVQSAKQDPLDFVLWKLAKPNEPSWPSPWGAGRPGWHIECSAMSMKCLGHTLDIHGGGFDLQFPHHENEIAQSEGATNKKFVHTWMHIGFLQINQEKMSKSLGNFFIIRDVLAHYPAEVLRYFLISSHYRSPLPYSSEALDNARQALNRFYLTLRTVPPSESEHVKNDPAVEEFHEAMNDDFNTPAALAVLFELTHKIHRLKDQDFSQAQHYSALLKDLAGTLGLIQQSPEHYLQKNYSSQQLLTEDEINALIEERQRARHEKRWADADAIRAKLNDCNITLEDKEGKTYWRHN